MEASYDEEVGSAVAANPMDNVALALQNEPKIIVPQIEPTVPTYASFQLMNTGAMSGRNRTTVVPQAGQTYNPGDKVRLFFPRQYWTDLQQAFLHFDVTFNVGSQNPTLGWDWFSEEITGLALGTGESTTVALSKRYVDPASINIRSVTSSDAGDSAENVFVGNFLKDCYGTASTQAITDGVGISALDNAADITAVKLSYRYFTPPSAFTVLQNGASTIISTMRILEAGNEIERIDEYGLLQRWLSLYHFHLEWVQSDGNIQGYYEDKLSGWKLNVSVLGTRSVKVNYCVPLWACGYFKQRYVPNPLMQEWQLEMTLDNFANTVTTIPGGGSSSGQVATNWTITNMELVIDILEPKPWYQMMIFEKRQMGALFMMIDSVTHHSRNINGSNDTVILTDKMESISKILWGLRLSTDINSTSGDSGIARSILDSTNNVALKDYKYKLGAMTYPDQPISHIKSLNINVPDGFNVTGKSIEVDYHSYELSLSCARKFRMDHLNETTAQKTTFNNPNRFYGFTVNDKGMPVPWDDLSATNEPQACAIYTSFEKDKGYVSGANTEAANIDMQIQMNFTNSIQNSVTGEFFLFFNQAIKIMNNGSTQKYK